MIKMLNLGRIQDIHVGPEGKKKGISGGERKRVAVGAELVINPSLLFLDEPTSRKKKYSILIEFSKKKKKKKGGLDSFTAESLVTLFKNLAQNGRTIISTLHQPSSKMFQLFDNLLLLARGEVVYYGPAKSSIQFFQDCGYPTPPLTNPTDLFSNFFYFNE